MQEEEARSNGDVQSVQRALTILRMLADERRPPRITDIVERTALPEAHLADVAGRQTRHIGLRIRELRQQPHLTGRLAADPAGTMEGENSILIGGGSQLQNLSRWGDYSSMTVDPVDDCTFWYTNEYLKTSGTFNWSTQIASFKFPGCQ